MSSFTLDTPHGLISIIDTALKNDAPTLLLLHGNSLSSKIFRHIIDSHTITQRWRVVAFCLPGHGSSSKAPDPAKSYNMRGYAEVAVHVLRHLNIASVIVLGWSLGGHVGIEMVELLKPKSTVEMRGLMLVGTPPALGAEQVRLGFTMASETGNLGLAGQKDWTDEVALAFSKSSAAADKGEFWEEWMYDNARNTDGRARMMMAQRFVGSGDERPSGVDQRNVVESEEGVLIAVVNGAEEQFVNLDYLDGIKWKNLWRGECMRLSGLHHAPFWEDPHRFQEVLLQFLEDAEKL
jgi:pimeloyl-ACP methyl ester carboxylesterase